MFDEDNSVLTIVWSLRGLELIIIDEEILLENVVFSLRRLNYLGSEWTDNAASVTSASNSFLSMTITNYSWKTIGVNEDKVRKWNFYSTYEICMFVSKLWDSFSTAVCIVSMCREFSSSLVLNIRWIFHNAWLLGSDPAWFTRKPQPVRKAKENHFIKIQFPRSNSEPCIWLLQSSNWNTQCVLLVAPRPCTSSHLKSFATSSRINVSCFW